jgi:hypothetical protein
MSLVALVVILIALNDPERSLDTQEKPNSSQIEGQLNG